MSKQTEIRNETLREVIQWLEDEVTSAEVEHQRDYTDGPFRVGFRLGASWDALETALILRGWIE